MIEGRGRDLGIGECCRSEGASSTYIKSAERQYEITFEAYVVYHLQFPRMGFLALLILAHWQLHYNMLLRKEREAYLEYLLPHQKQ